MPDSTLQPKLPLADTFAAEYLAYYRMLPLELTADRLRVAVAGRPHDEALEDLRDSYGLPLELIPVEEVELQDAIRQTFAASESVVELVRDLTAGLDSPGDATDDQLADVRDLVNQPPVIRFVNLLIRESYRVRRRGTRVP